MKKFNSPRAKSKLLNNKTIYDKFVEFIISESDPTQTVLISEIAASYAANNHPGYFSSSKIEQALLKIAPDYVSDSTASESDGKFILHIMTSALRTGGHTKLVENWIKLQPNFLHHVLITEPSFSEVPKSLTDVVKNSGGRIHQLLEDELWTKVAAIRKIAKDALVVLLHTHPHDAKPLLAFGCENWIKPSIVLVNHGDQRFWLGVSIADMVICLTADEVSLVKDRKGVRLANLLPIPILRQEKVGQRSPPNQIDNPVILTVAASRKLEKSDDFDYLEFALKFLEVHPTVKFLVVGPNDKDSRWKKYQAKSNGRIRAMGIMPREEIRAKLFPISTVYLDSFPLNSYTSMLEAALYGIPVLSLKTLIPELPGFEGRALANITDLEAALLRALSSEVVNPPDLKVYDQDRWAMEAKTIINQVLIGHHQITVFDSKCSLGQYDQFLAGLGKQYSSIAMNLSQRLAFRNKVRIFIFLMSNPWYHRQSLAKLALALFKQAP